MIKPRTNHISYPDSVLHTVVILGLLCVIGCNESQVGDRSAWLSRTISQDHWHLIKRSPHLVEGKFTKMMGEFNDGSSSLYPFMRGTLAQMYRDLAGDYQGIIPSRFASSEGILTLLIGDPHIENLSTRLTSQGHLTLDWDDFDSAGYGPWIWDLRRLALSWWVFATELNEPHLARLFISGITDGYLMGVYDWQDGQRARPQEGQFLPLPLRKLFIKSRTKASESQLLHRYTDLDVSQQYRSFKRGEIRVSNQEGVIKDALLSLNAKESVLLDGLIEKLRQQLGDLGPVKDLVRKYGQGVSSYPLMRFFILFEGQSSSTLDDEIWEIKELADRPAPPQLPLYPSRQFGAQGARVLHARRSLQWGEQLSLSSPLPCTWIDVGNTSFRVRQRSELQRGLNLNDLVEYYQEAQGQDERNDRLNELVQIAQLMGQLLAGAHSYASTLTSVQGGEVIIKDLSRGGIELLAGETYDFTQKYGQQVQRDRHIFSKLIHRDGSLFGLGMER